MTDKERRAINRKYIVIHFICLIVFPPVVIITGFMHWYKLNS